MWFSCQFHLNSMRLSQGICQLQASIFSKSSVSFEYRYSPNCLNSASSVDVLQTISIEDSASSDSPTLWWVCYQTQLTEKGRAPGQLQALILSTSWIASLMQPLKGEDPQSASSINIHYQMKGEPLIASPPNAIDRKGRAPCQLHESIFPNPLIQKFPTSCNGYSKKHEVLWSITAFDLVALVHTLQRFQTMTNLVIEVHALCFTLFGFARSSKSPEPNAKGEGPLSASSIDIPWLFDSFTTRR